MTWWKGVRFGFRFGFGGIEPVRSTLSALADFSRSIGDAIFEAVAVAVLFV